MARGLVSRLPFVKLGAGAKRPVRVLKALTGVLKPVGVVVGLGWGGGVVIMGVLMMGWGDEMKMQGLLCVCATTQ